MTLEAGTNEEKHWTSLSHNSILVNDIKKGKELNLYYSYETKKETIDKNTEMYSTIRKTLLERITKIKKNAPRLDIYVEKVK